MRNLSFRGQREPSMGLQLQQKDQNHTAISHRCQARKQVGEKAQSSPNFGLQILNCEQKFSRPRKANYSFHQAAHTWSFSNVSALELSSMVCRADK